jgi:hypothetical protein
VYPETVISAALRGNAKADAAASAAETTTHDFFIIRLSFIDHIMANHSAEVKAKAGRAKRGALAAVADDAPLVFLDCTCGADMLL